MVLLEKIQKIVALNAQLQQKNADLETKLAEALADDAADDKAIVDQMILAEQAQVAAQAAIAAVEPLRFKISANADQEIAINLLLDSVIYPEDEPTEATEPTI